MISAMIDKGLSDSSLEKAELFSLFFLMLQIEGNSRRICGLKKLCRGTFVGCGGGRLGFRCSINQAAAVLFDF